MAFAAPARASADEPTESHTPGRGFYVAANAGYGALSTASGWMTLAPVGIEVGGHPGRFTEFGGFADYASSTVGGCSACDGWRWRAGLIARVHYGRTNVLDPWVAGGAGYERLQVPAQSATTGSWFGLILPRVSVGLDVHVTRAFFVAPFVGSQISFYSYDAPMWTQSFRFQLEGGLRIGFSP